MASTITTSKELRPDGSELYTIDDEGKPFPFQVLWKLCRSMRCDRPVVAGFDPNWADNRRQYCSPACKTDVFRYPELDRYPEIERAG